MHHLLGLQRTDGYWWFTLEANETIGAEFIFLMNFLGNADPLVLQGIARRIRDVQRADGTWALYYDGPADLSSTVECYFALKLAGVSPTEPCMQKARSFILAQGGIEKVRVFTRIHLALFGIVPWDTCPAMPLEAILLPEWFPVNIYSFSSWARATIVPLFIISSFKPVKPVPGIDLEELFLHPAPKRRYDLKSKEGFLSWEYAFIHFDKIIKKTPRISLGRLRNLSIYKAKKWISEHIDAVEDIYPALAYAALAMKTLGEPNDSPIIKKAVDALTMFQQVYDEPDLPALPDEIRDDGITRPSQLREQKKLPGGTRIHQQCCISPVWDTPWSAVALLEAGVPPDHPAMIKAARWLIKKQILGVRGDWSVRCPEPRPGGWAFEFENDYFPDVDDTIQVLHVLHRVTLPATEKMNAIERGLEWAIAMQNDDGGWAAFDKNNRREIVNRIPFSDHGACLDPSSPDITGRMLELLLTLNFSPDERRIRRAIDYLRSTQESFGGWFARWGINYIYGTWAVLTGLAPLKTPEANAMVERGAKWLASVQRPDGGWGESPESYVQKAYVPLGTSTASQTAWAVMGLVAAGKTDTPECRRGIEFLLNEQNQVGTWDELHHTGTGFPGHFYIRYHGYRSYFPLLALARYRNA
ncbi:MAG: terpene cyclase/mutase family protein [Deltaproteobacteria bacterium]|nr:terpene cyclase/mutase family protein [Deltaproteobacteria bacterium]